jgi:hypothetical protein
VLIQQRSAMSRAYHPWVWWLGSSLPLAWRRGHSGFSMRKQPPASPGACGRRFGPGSRLRALEGQRPMCCL